MFVQFGFFIKSVSLFYFVLILNASVRLKDLKESNVEKFERDLDWA